LDVFEAITVLRGEEGGRLRELATMFAARAVAATSNMTYEEAASRAERAIADGSALERFREMVAAQGGDPHVVDDPAAVLPRAPIVVPLMGDRSGTLAAVAAEEIGRASAALGAGRIGGDDPIDRSVGIVFRPTIGDRIAAGEPIGEVHARSLEEARAAAARTLAAMSVVEGPVAKPSLVHVWLEEG
jgi:pyrimidine-nucleoside phosphorylase